MRLNNYNSLCAVIFHTNILILYIINTVVNISNNEHNIDNDDHGIEPKGYKQNTS